MKYSEWCNIEENRKYFRRGMHTMAGFAAFIILMLVFAWYSSKEDKAVEENKES